MGSYRQLLYHIVFSPYRRENVLTKYKRDILFRYISGIIKNKHCYLYAINGVEDHIHILTEIIPRISVSDFIKDIKVASSIFIKENKLFIGFRGWQTGYGIFTHSLSSKTTLIRYVQNQEKHHKSISFYDEYKKLLS